MTRHDITPKAIRWVPIRHLQKKRLASAKGKQGKGYVTVWRSREAKGWRHALPTKSDKSLTKDPNKENVNELNVWTAGTSKTQKKI